VGGAARSDAESGVADAALPFPESVALFVFVTTSRQTLREALEVRLRRYQRT
jgi:hypothetical protein